MPESATPDIVEFTLGETTLRFHPSTLHLCSLSVAGEEWFTGGEAGEPLWTLLAVDEAGKCVTLSGSAAAACAAEEDGDELRLLWRQVTDARTGAGPFTVRVAVRPGDDAGVTAWRISVENHGGWTLWSVTFPQLPHLLPSAEPEADRLFYPEGWGTQRVGWSQMVDLHCRYPFGWDCPLQLLGYTREANTLSLATYDPELTTKEFHFARHNRAGQRWADLAVISYPEGMSTPGNSLAQAYDTVVAVQPGDWYDAARRYAGWARRQPWACDAPAPRAADDVQGWQVLYVDTKSPEEWSALMEQLAARVGVRLGIHFYHWHEVPFDASYPDYFPAREGFVELVARTRRAGYLAMPYINGRLWDINAPSWPARGAERYAAKGSALRLHPLTLFPYLEEYGSGQKLAPMCPTTPFWQDTVLDLCARIIGELGCDGVYIDQIAAARAELCFEPAHGHTLGGGKFWLEGYRRLLARIRAAVPQAYLTTECNWEGCVADYDGLLTWHSLGEGLIPLFPAVYSGLAKTFGCQFNAADLGEDGGLRFTTRMAYLFVWGAQLGWGDLSLLLDDAHAPLLDYFTTLCRTRAEHQETFTSGRMLRPPVLRITRPAEVNDAQCGAATPAPLPVYASLWQRPSGDGATVFLVNPTREQLSVEVGIRAEARVPIDEGEQSILGLLHRAPEDTLDLQDELQICPRCRTYLPPLSVVVLPLNL